MTTTKPNLSHKLGLCISHWPLEPIDWWLQAGMRHFRIGIEWAVFNPDRGAYIFPVAAPAFQKIANAGGKILVHLFMTPSYLKPEYPRINKHPFAIPIMRSDWVVDWVDFVSRFLEWAEQFGDAIQVCGPVVETNLPGWWEKERTPEEIASGVQKQERSPEDFIAQVIRPVAPIIRFHGKKVIAGTVTLQGERIWTFERAVKYFEHYKNRNFGSIDHMDFHVYREIGNDTVADIKRVFAHFEKQSIKAFLKALEEGKTDEEAKQIAEKAKLKNPVWISELGFNEKGGFTFWERLSNLLKGRNPSGQERQERKYKQLFSFLESDPDAQKIKRIYLYRAHGGGIAADGDELLDENFNPKKAALLIREYLQA